MSKSSTTTEPMALEGMRRAPTHPGALLADMLAHLDVSIAEAARRVGVTRGMLSQVVTGHRPMPATLCVKLAALLGTSVEFWGSLQMRHDLWHALQDKATKKAVKAIEPLVERPIAFQPGELSVPVADNGLTFPAASPSLGTPIAVVLTDGRRSRVRTLR